MDSWMGIRGEACEQCWRETKGAKQ
jgi:hypothetical protein